MCTTVAVTSADLNLYPGSRTEYHGSGVSFTAGETA